jgi:2-oxo-3-hexenedioate decarboxylase
MDRRAVARRAAEVLALQDGASLAEPLSAREPGFGLPEAYAVALELLRLRERSGWQRVGRKLGFTNRTIYEQYGVYAPIFGYMYAQTLSEASFDGRAGWRARLPLAGLAQPRIEPEVFFRLRSAPPSGAAPEELLQAVEWLGHGFEIVQCHFRDWRFQAADTVADGGLHGRYVLGPGLPVAGANRRELAEQLASFRIVLLRDGSPVAEGGGALVLGSPLNALAHLIDVLDGLPDHPRLQAGELITTGTLTAALPVAAGETWSTRVQGLPLPGLALDFV